VLDLDKPGERAAHDLIRRVSSGRWPMWRLLGMCRRGQVLVAAVKWTRWRSARPYSVVDVYLDEPALCWRCFATATEARAALAALDVKTRPPTAPATPALMEGGAL
jgi:hypothetical protein